MPKKPVTNRQRRKSNMSFGGKRVRVVTMGCSKNRVDSEHLLMQLSAAGWEVSPEEEPLEDAGVDVLHYQHLRLYP